MPTLKKNKPDQPAVPTTPHVPGRAGIRRMVGAPGFTLMEILVVLVVMGLLAGMVLPRIQNMFTTYELSGQKKSLTLALQRLGYQAYLLGRELELDMGNLRAGQNDMRYLIALPPGWKLRTDAPITYSANGVCSGGRLDLVDPRGGVESFLLRPPVCRLDRLEAAE